MSEHNKTNLPAMQLAKTANAKIFQIQKPLPRNKIRRKQTLSPLLHQPLRFAAWTRP